MYQITFDEFKILCLGLGKIGFLARYTGALKLAIAIKNHSQHYFFSIINMNIFSLFYSFQIQTHHILVLMEPLE